MSTDYFSPWFPPVNVKPVTFSCKHFYKYYNDQDINVFKSTAAFTLSNYRFNMKATRQSLWRSSAWNQRLCRCCDRFIFLSYPACVSKWEGQSVYITFCNGAAVQSWNKINDTSPWLLPEQHITGHLLKTTSLYPLSCGENNGSRC